MPPPWPCTLFCSRPLHVLPCSCLGCKFFMPRVAFLHVCTEHKRAGAWCFWQHKRCLWRRWIHRFPHPCLAHSHCPPSRITCSSVAVLSAARCEQARQRQVRRGTGWGVNLAGKVVSVSCLLCGFGNRGWRGSKWERNRQGKAGLEGRWRHSQRVCWLEAEGGRWGRAGALRK